MDLVVRPAAAPPARCVVGALWLLSLAACPPPCHPRLRAPSPDALFAGVGAVLGRWLAHDHGQGAVRTLAAVLSAPAPAPAPLPEALLAALHRHAVVALGVLPSLPRARPPLDPGLSYRYELLLFGDAAGLAAALPRAPLLPQWNPHARVFLVLPGPAPAERMRRLVATCIYSHHIYNPVIVAPRGAGAVRVYTFHLVNSNGHVHVVLDEVVSPAQFESFFGTLKDMNGYPINITMFPTVPYAVLANASGGGVTYGGCDGLMMRTIVEKINATPRIFEPENGQYYGVRRADGSYTGAALDLASGRADIAFNSRYVKYEWREDIDFTYPHDKGNMAVIVRKAPLVPLYLHLFLPFPPLTWAALALALPTVTLVWWAVRRAEQRLMLHRGNAQNSTLQYVHLLTVSSFLSMNVTSPRTYAERIFFAFWIIFSMIVTSTFQGSLVSYLAVPKFLKDIDTLEELYHSGQTILVYPSVVDILHQNSDPDSLLSKMQHKFVKFENFHDMPEEVLTRAGVAAMVEEHMAGFLVRERGYATAEGAPRLHVVAERPLHAFLAYGLARGSALRPRLAALTAALVQAGLYAKWRRDAVRAAELQGRLAPPPAAAPHQATAPPTKLRPEHLQSAFYLLLLGLGGATVVLLLECFHARKTVSPTRLRSKRSMLALTYRCYLYEDVDENRFKTWPSFNH